MYIITGKSLQLATCCHRQGTKTLQSGQKWRKKQPSIKWKMLPDDAKCHFLIAGAIVIYFPSGMEYMYEYIEAYTPKSTSFHRQRTGAGCPGWRCRSCPSGPCSCTPSGPTCPGTLPQPSVHLCLSYLVNIRDDEFRNVINDKSTIHT